MPSWHVSDPGAKRQHFPKIRVVPLNDARHIALHLGAPGHDWLDSNAIQYTTDQQKYHGEDAHGEFCQPLDVMNRIEL